ncbi:secreted RxLR effector protein 161-like [Vicia villosa]|uniref:secreted RxLR effector protein 161-like n=1 Tax=Vicia villosa TaxID=3911 RepID=UPI00273B83EB|nr:secreted RxLR effector protein 161-like [Vicia villosa]
MEHCNIDITPAEPKLQLSKNEHEKDVNLTRYQRLIGSLRYLCNTRPNLDFSVEIMSKFMEILKMSHFVAVKRILRYIKGSIGCGILFPTTDKGIKYNLFSYTHSNWCKNKDDRKSTDEYIFMFRETPISWFSKKKSVVALSSCEAEYIATSLCAWQAVRLMNLLKELFSEDGEIVMLMVDNVSAINLAKNPITHERNKYIKMRLHYFRELISEGRLRLAYYRNED